MEAERAVERGPQAQAGCRVCAGQGFTAYLHAHTQAAVSCAHPIPVSRDHTIFRTSRV